MLLRLDLSSNGLLSEGGGALAGAIAGSHTAPQANTHPGAQVNRVRVRVNPNPNSNTNPNLDPIVLTSMPAIVRAVS